MSANNTKIYGLRLEEELIDQYKRSINDLPLIFDHKKLLQSYMEYVIKTADKYKETGELEIHIPVDGKFTKLTLKEENE